MKTQKSVAKSVASTAHLHWVAPRFNVRWAESEKDVPEYDISRFQEFKKMIGEVSENWEAHRDICKINAAPSSPYPRLVVNVGEGFQYQEEALVPPGNLLKDLAGLYRLTENRNASVPNDAFKLKVLELAHRYTPFATYLPGDEDLRGLTLKAWFDLACEVHVFSEFIQELNSHLLMKDIKKSVEKQWKETQQIDSPLTPYWKHLKNAYTDYVDPDSFGQDLRIEAKTQKRVIDYRKKLQISNEGFIRQRMARDLRARLGRHSLSFMSVRDTSSSIERYTYQLLCVVGICEWASLLLAEKLPKHGYIQICEVCSKTFLSIKYDARICSSTCRSRRSREKKAEQ